MQMEVYQTSISGRALLSINTLLNLFIFFFDSDCIFFCFFLPSDAPIKFTVYFPLLFCSRTAFTLYG